MFVISKENILIQMCSFELTLSKLAQKIKLVKNPISFLLLTYIENICKDSHATFPFITYLAILRDNLYMILVPYCKLLPTCKAKTSLCTLCKKSGFLEKCIGNFTRKTLKFKHNAESFFKFLSKNVNRKVFLHKIPDFF